MSPKPPFRVRAWFNFAQSRWIAKRKCKAILIMALYTRALIYMPALKVSDKVWPSSFLHHTRFSKLLTLVSLCFSLIKLNYFLSLSFSLSHLIKLNDLRPICKSRLIYIYILIYHGYILMWASLLRNRNKVPLGYMYIHMNVCKVEN